MFITNSIAKLHNELDPIRHKGGRRRCISLVTVRPGLHEGHGAVINAAKTLSDALVVAILPGPRPHQPPGNVVSATEFHDISFIENHTAQVLFKPSEDDLFPFDDDQMVKIEPCEGMQGVDFEAESLLAHLKVINIVQPDVMVWGEKKFIEYAYVRKLIAEMDIRTQVQCIPTVRHTNGVPVGREDESVLEDTDLPIIYQTLTNAAHAIKAGARNFDSVARTARLPLKGAGFKVAYFTVFDENTMRPATSDTTSYRIATRATINGKTYSDSLGLTL